jgi:hypothetical protein
MVRAVGLPQHPDEHRSKPPILLTVDQKLGERLPPGALAAETPHRGPCSARPIRPSYRTSCQAVRVRLGTDPALIKVLLKVTDKGDNDWGRVRRRGATTSNRGRSIR